MKPKFNNRLDYRLFIKGTKAFLSGEIDDCDGFPECPFVYAREGMNIPERKLQDFLYSDYDCATYCGGVFKEILNKDHIKKGCPCHYFSPKQVRDRARAHLKRAIQEYKMFYR